MPVKRYVDVNVFVYWLAGDPEYGKQAKQWISRIEGARPGSYVTSSLTVYELAVILGRLTGKGLRDSGLAETIMEALSGLRGLEVVELAWNDYHKAVELMKEYNLDLEDALHLAVALRAGAKEIVSNDTDFDKAPLARIF